MFNYFIYIFHFFVYLSWINISGVPSISNRHFHLSLIWHNWIKEYLYSVFSRTYGWLSSWGISSAHGMISALGIESYARLSPRWLSFFWLTYFTQRNTLLILNVDQMTGIHSFWGLSNNKLLVCVYTTSYLSLHLLKDIMVPSTVWLLYTLVP